MEYIKFNGEQHAVDTHRGSDKETKNKRAWIATCSSQQSSPLPLTSFKHRQVFIGDDVIIVQVQITCFICMWRCIWFLPSSFFRFEYVWLCGRKWEKTEFLFNFVHLKRKSEKIVENCYELSTKNVSELSSSQIHQLIRCASDYDHNEEAATPINKTARNFTIIQVKLDDFSIWIFDDDVVCRIIWAFCFVTRQFSFPYTIFWWIISGIDSSVPPAGYLVYINSLSLILAWTPFLPPFSLHQRAYLLYSML